jgi:hypothetical protein
VISKAVFSALDGDWQRVIAEVRIRAQCTCASNDGLDYITTQVLGPNVDWPKLFRSNLSHSSVRLEVEAQYPKSALDTPKRELTLEVLRGDPRSLYVELMSQWPQFPMNAPMDPARVREFKSEPSKYIDDADSFLRNAMTLLPGGINNGE